MKFKKRFITLLLSSLFFVTSCGNSSSMSSTSGRDSISSQNDELDTSSDEYSDDPYFFVPLDENTCKVVGRTDTQKGKEVEEIDIPTYSPAGERVVEIGEFDSRIRLKKVIIPETVVTLVDGVFSDCQALETVEFPTEYAVCEQCCGDDYQEINEIPYKAFYNCVNLKNINIPDLIGIIGNAAFCQCTSLETIELSNDLYEIEPYAFYDCTSLKSINISNNVKYLNYSFGNCKSLTSITIPASVKYLDDFMNCRSLVDVTLENGIREIFSDSFKNTNIKQIFIPKSVGYIEGYAFEGCSKDLIIYCEAPSLPCSWSEYWNYSNYQVVWNASREDLSK